MEVLSKAVIHCTSDGAKDFIYLKGKTRSFKVKKKTNHKLSK